MSEKRQQRSVDTAVYRNAPQVTWTVETYGICLLNQNTGKVKSLAYPQAAIWDLMTQGYPHSRIVNLVSMIGSLNFDTTEKIVRECLEQWTDDGFTIKEVIHG